VFGVTDRNDAVDDDHGLIVNERHTGVLDAEVKYYLNETFNPFDLYDAVHKQESRWLYLNSSLTTATSYITLTEGLSDSLYYAVMPSEYESLGAASPTWTGYFLRDSGTYPAESEWMNEYEDGIDAHSKNWALILNGTGTEEGGYEMLKVTPTVGTPTSTAPLTLQLKDLVDFDFWYYQIGGTRGPTVQIKIYNSSAGGETGNYWANIMAEWENPIVAAGWHHYTLNNITNYVPGWAAETPFTVTGNTGFPAGWHSYEYITSNQTLANYYVGSVGIQCDNAPTNNTAYVDDLSVAYLDKVSGIRYERVYNMEEDKLVPSDWDAYCSSAERVLINGTLIENSRHANLTAHESYYNINYETGNITFYHWTTGLLYHAWDLGIGTHVKVLYSTIEENEKGRYEWMVVGKDAAAIDSIGAAYMTEAFDSRKDIEVLLTGLDINDTANGPHAPFVMGGAATGTKADYRDSLGRPHLRDDWCTTYPVSSSNMLFSGGPRAQMGTEYFNEFTNAFFARSEYVVNDTGQANKIMALTCWNRTTYGAGYAVISVYKDLNGTIGFLIWGFDGQDTYYATQWFWSIPDGLEAPDDIIVYSGIEYLQHENRGVTDIILEIDYTTCPCSVSVTEERLGTISEKAQHDP
jgi:hypothetical protein